MTFKVGDKVRVKGNPALKVGTVACRLHDVYEVKFDGYDFPVGCSRFIPGAGTYSPKALEKIERPSQDFRLRHGDTIVNNKTGRVGHVVEGQNEVLWVVDHTYCEESGATAAEVEGYEELHPGTYEITKRAEPF